ncbi:triple tyrosine motif-containing protein [Lewinella cohaerens]|uniref:triple tyrosine motif-containing protein n=1 Tax=Lewinella cohaerens TaxID=70995 RepID=UPI0003A2F62D
MSTRKIKTYTQVIGIDKDWVYHGNTPSIRFNGLTLGMYILRVKGADSRDDNSAGELQVPF